MYFSFGSFNVLGRVTASSPGLCRLSFYTAFTRTKYPPHSHPSISRFRAILFADAKTKANRMARKRWRDDIIEHKKKARTFLDEGKITRVVF
jgi:hypothetical protein